MVPLSFAGHEFDVVAPAALFWPAQRALLVADLHLEKASFFARQGQMLPPYDSQATLDALSDLITKTGAQKVFCLGDNYHDDGGEKRLESKASSLLKKLTREIEWIWISGNHDRDVSGLWGGRVMREWTDGGLVLRHEATKNPKMPEISGHYHPKYRVQVRGRNLSRCCFVMGKMHLIMPAFGALTGGMSADDQAIESVVGGPADAIIGLDKLALHFPLGFSSRSVVNAGQTQFDFPEPRTAARA
ncbi:ligase-associated DNA damage response endonuclease PdeM [Parasphingorhabdus halotolerans]|uniref:Ligase-associated DNA damage response endonuclease PdeM n=1 Tax=Parasphingorhabdus halotolerans TaxID=2725558 RepID=A0A6H2DNV8_9SPHN|nr:ligase-associated DNA damage response endonuclease PdeM [Parasphingorhabdus halotolerans]QJB69645.1 ligase-associated DNA damage response endonuclease PdeM [Parasphingorhabdus halotolerans]